MDQKTITATLYLIPVTLGETALDRVLPAYNITKVGEITHFIVENVRTARRFLKQCHRDRDIDSLTFYTLNQHTTAEEIASYLVPMERGISMGVISEAGCPAIADPGADIVAIAQRKGLKVEPWVGPSSLLMGLMASGFNGQSFAFNGYLPIDERERAQRLAQLENRIYQEDQTQLFIETPYRNDKLVEELIRRCRPTTRLCIASNLSCQDEYIATHTLSEWNKQKSTLRLHKIPTLFLLYK